MFNRKTMDLPTCIIREREGSWEFVGLIQKTEGSFLSYFTSPFTRGPSTHTVDESYYRRCGSDSACNDLIPSLLQLLICRSFAPVTSRTEILLTCLADLIVGFMLTVQYGFKSLLDVFMDFCRRYTDLLWLLFLTSLTFTDHWRLLQSVITLNLEYQNYE